jgi:uncharacterized membrane-anchored protein
MFKQISALLAVAALLMLASTPAAAQDANKGKAKLDVLKGPATARLGAVAQVEVPAGYAFLDGKATRAMMKAVGEPTSGNEVGFLRPTNGHWSVYFEFSDVGYVKDDEKDKLDADKLLKQIIAGNDAGNEQRKRAGNPPLIIVGWEQPPKYNPETHNLEWAIRATSEGQPILNYNTRLLGRKGVMEVILVCDPKDLAETLPSFRGLLADHKFVSGESYAEYRQGDKLAKYGLAALITGGAAVGAAKLGLFTTLAVFFKKAWKLVVVGVVAVAGLFKKIFSRLTGRSGETRLED